VNLPEVDRSGPLAPSWQLLGGGGLLSRGVEPNVRVHSADYAASPVEIRSSTAIRSEIGGCVSKR
jgi:hypothetical protein